MFRPALVQLCMLRTIQNIPIRHCLNAHHSKDIDYNALHILVLWNFFKKVIQISLKRKPYQGNCEDKAIIHTNLAGNWLSVMMCLFLFLKHCSKLYDISSFKETLCILGLILTVSQNIILEHFLFLSCFTNLIVGA